MRSHLSFERTSRFLLVVAVWISARPEAIAAQVPANLEMVRKDLLMALLNTDRVSPMSARAALPPEVLIGATTPAIERELTLPTGSELLGTITGNESSEVLALVPLGFDSTRVALQRALEEKGWKTPEAAAVAIQRGGFVQPTPSMGLEGTLCKGQASTARLLVAPVGGRPGMSFARVVFHDASGFCAMRPQLSTSNDDPFVVLPPLHSPAGNSGVCMDAGPHSRSGTSIVLGSSLAPNDLLAHYGRQLEAAGWSNLPATAAGSVWTKPDSSGPPMETHLIVKRTASHGACYEAMLTLSRK